MSIESIAKNKKRFASYRMYAGRILFAVAMLAALGYVLSTLQYIATDWTNIQESKEKTNRIKQETEKIVASLPSILNALQDENGQWIFEQEHWQYRQRIVNKEQITAAWREQPNQTQISTISTSELSGNEKAIMEFLKFFNSSVSMSFLNECKKYDNGNMRIYEMLNGEIPIRLTTVIVNDVERFVEGKLALPISNNVILLLTFNPSNGQIINKTIDFPPCPQSGKIVCTKTDSVGNVRIVFLEVQIAPNELAEFWRRNNWSVQLNNVDSVFSATCSKDKQVIEVTGKIQNDAIVSLMLVPINL